MNAPLSHDYAGLHDDVAVNGVRMVEGCVQRIRGFYFYIVGTHMRALVGINMGNKLEDKYYDLSVAKTDIDALLHQVLMPLRTARQSAVNLLSVIEGRS